MATEREAKSDFGDAIGDCRAQKGGNEENCTTRDRYT